MGLAQKQAIRDFNEKDFPGYLDMVKSSGVTSLITVDWDTFPGDETLPVKRAGKVAYEMADQLQRMAKDPMAKDELNAQIESIHIQNDASVEGEYVYSIVKSGKQFIFKANLMNFIVHDSHQKSFKSVMTDLL
jgi:hypothetical protein